MRSFSPTAEGFRLVFRRPSIPTAEIAWRWSFGTAVWFLVSTFLLQYAGSLPVNTVDRLLLGTQQPVLILRALRRIFHGSALRFTEAGLLLTIAMTIGWIVLASIGRVVTLRAMMQEFRIAGQGSQPYIVRIAALNFLRTAATLAAVIGALGAALLAHGVRTSSHWTAADAARIWLALLILVWIAWSIVNWLLSTAALFVVLDAGGAVTALAKTVAWCRDRLGPVLIAGVLFGLAHGGALLVACGAGLTVLGMANVLGMGPTWILGFLIIAAYCLLADFLYTARLASYLVIARSDEMPSFILAHEPPPIKPLGETAVDQSELILSDVPVPAT